MYSCCWWEGTPGPDATVWFQPLWDTPCPAKAVLEELVIRSQRVINLWSPFQGINDGKQSVLSAARLLSWAGEERERAVKMVFGEVVSEPWRILIGDEKLGCRDLKNVDFCIWWCYSPELAPLGLQMPKSKDVAEVKGRNWDKSPAEGQWFLSFLSESLHSKRKKLRKSSRELMDFPSFVQRGCC